MNNTITTSPKDELAALFASLGLTAEVTGAHAAIDTESGIDGKGWPHVAVTVTFTRQPVDNGHGRAVGKAVSASFDWRMGTGVIDWKALAKPRSFQSVSDARDVAHMAAHGSRLTAESQRQIAAKHLSAFVKQVNPAEVLGYACREGQDAAGQSFAEWADSYGYDQDSRKAEATYRACQEGGDKARRLLSHSPGAFAKLAELAGQL